MKIANFFMGERLSYCKSGIQQWCKNWFKFGQVKTSKRGLNSSQFDLRDVNGYQITTQK